MTSEYTDLREVKGRYGGIDLPATIAGFFAGLGVLVFLAAIIAGGAGNIEYQMNLIDVEGNLAEVSIIGAGVAIAALFVAFFVGGWAAARIARYDGGGNGFIAGVWMVALMFIFGALGVWVGSEYDVFTAANLPSWVAQWDADDMTMVGIVTGVVGIVAVLGGGWLGGRVGELYHRKVDAAVVSAPPVRSEGI